MFTGTTRKINKIIFENVLYLAIIKTTVINIGLKVYKRVSERRKLPRGEAQEIQRKLH